LALERKKRLGLKRHSLTRTRTEWLSPNVCREKGEIRNIHILGRIRGRLVVAYQGRGHLNIHLDHEHSPPLEEVGDGLWHREYKAHLQAVELGPDEQVPLLYRFAEYELPFKTCKVIVVGVSEAGEDQEGPAARPIQEAKTSATILYSGHLKHQMIFPSQRGEPPRPRCLNGTVASLSASQKIFV